MLCKTAVEGFCKVRVTYNVKEAKLRLYKVCNICNVKSKTKIGLGLSRMKYISSKSSISQSSSHTQCKNKCKIQQAVSRIELESSKQNIFQIVGHRQYQYLWHYLDYQKKLVPRENAANYFHTLLRYCKIFWYPPVTHSATVPGIKIDRSLRVSKL